jgi:uncharacterized protein (TIGR03083 family)
MTDLTDVADVADRIISSLQSEHDQLTELVARLDDDQLTAPSGAAGWTVADVLSHLGSGAEIMQPRLEAAVAGVPAPETDNQAIWDRWNGLSPRDQAVGFVETDGRLLGLVLGLTPEQRAATRIDLGFLPEPVPLTVSAGMRLNEVALHSWDVRVGVDGEATVDAETAELVLELFSTDLGFLLGFSGKAETLGEPAEVAIGEYALIVDSGVSVRAGRTAPTATFDGPPEAVIRLIAGRLGPEHTPGGVRVTGNVSLDDLRGVFPGY